MKFIFVTDSMGKKVAINLDNITKITSLRAGYTFIHLVASMDPVEVKDDIADLVKRLNGQRGLNDATN